MERDPGSFARCLETLERHDFVQPDAARRDRYAFTHDLVRRAVSSDLSEPRRRLMHLRFASVLPAGGNEPETVEVAHHAALAGDLALAARACTAAARQCLRVFAGAEADALSRRALHYAASLEDRARVPLLLELHEIRFAVRRPRNEAALAAELEALAESALDLGLSEHARLGFHLLAYLRWETGGAEDANRFMMRAELVSRAGGEEQRILAMAEAARCLAILDRDLPRAEALALEAGALGRRAGVEPVAVPDAIGILRLQQGRIADARTHFGRALELARASRDRLGEFTATEHLVMTEIEDGRHARAGQLAAGLVIIARKLREGSEAPFADALAALSRYLGGDETAREALDVAIADLRSADAKQRLIYVLTRAAGAELTRGLHASAARRAAEALRCAELLERPSDVERARALLVAAERRS